MASPICFDIPLNVGIVIGFGDSPSPAHWQAFKELFAVHDRLVFLSHTEFKEANGLDLVVASNLCGSTLLSETVAKKKMPTLVIDASQCYHPYHAWYYRDLKSRGGIVLPAHLRENIIASIAAVRAQKAMRTMHLIVADPGNDDLRNAEIQTFTQGIAKALGLTIHVRNTQEISERAKSYDDIAADAELARWYEDILEGQGEMDQVHMRQVAKLYLAQRAMLDEVGAVGITSHDIRGFLLPPDGNRQIMPNVSYGPLVFDGFLVAEEADITVLATELLLYAGLGSHPTMSNIYFAYRDQCTALKDVDMTNLDNVSLYTSEMQLADCRQCFDDNHITAAHFSTSGILPLNMMLEKKYRVRETLPSWPGQSMIASTPKFGSVTLARLSSDGAELHLETGEVDGLGFGDQYGWYRGRWFIKLPDAHNFADRAIHQHYAIASNDLGRMGCLKTLTNQLLNLKSI